MADGLQYVPASICEDSRGAGARGEENVKAWYFSTAEKKLRYGDDRHIAIGTTHEVEGKPLCCAHGLHGCEMILDALNYAPGTIIWIVELDGAMDIQDDKVAATSRTYLHGGIDVLPIILAWSRRVALDVAHLWDIPEIVRRYLETGDQAIAGAANAFAYAANASAYAYANASANAAARGKYSGWLAEDVYAAIMLAKRGKK